MNYALAEETEKIFVSNEIYFELWDCTDKTITIEIDGDWKHSHLRADYLMQQNGFKLVSKWVTEDDGSDWFKEVHKYRKEN